MTMHRLSLNSCICALENHIINLPWLDRHTHRLLLLSTVSTIPLVLKDPTYHQIATCIMGLHHTQCEPISINDPPPPPHSPSSPLLSLSLCPFLDLGTNLIISIIPLSPSPRAFGLAQCLFGLRVLKDRSQTCNGTGRREYTVHVALTLC